MRSRITALLSVVVLLLTAGAAPPAGVALTGFSAQHSAAELQLEGRFDAAIERSEMGAWIERLSRYPNHLGSRYDRLNIEFARRLLAAWGYHTQIERFDVLFPTPRTRELELIAPRHYRATLEEAPVRGDPVARQSHERLPPYVAYSIDGDVTAPLVYVNYGGADDYAALHARGVDVRGTIVIARYGRTWRGEKPKVAAQHGAVGCILYTDPQDEGYTRGDVYPAGPWRNASMVQRGSVEQIERYPGDPLTPGVAATAGAARLPFATAAQRRKIPVLTTIPVLPISYGDALPLLHALGGPVASAAMSGTLPITYHIGPGPARVHLKVAFAWTLTPLYDLIATLRGSERPAELIVRGNHIDSWTNGAMDPHAGTVAELEEARIIGALARAGMRPKRTLVYALWDGEEEGFIGSTEWVEGHARLLANAAIYIGTDDLGRGPLSVAGSHSLETAFEEAAERVRDPDSGVSVVERQRAHARLAPDERDRDGDGDGTHIGALGAGSDWTAFLDHAGVPSIYTEFTAETLWHSAYDSYAYVTRFSDPGFRYAAAEARLSGRLTLRFANADVVPYGFSAFAATMKHYVQQVQTLGAATAATIAAHNASATDDTYHAGSADGERLTAPATEPTMPTLDFAPLTAALTRLTVAARRYDGASRAALDGTPTLSAQQWMAADALVIRAERELLDARGLPQRPWYQHQIYAPGATTGYSAKTMPMIREGIEAHAFGAAALGIHVVAAALVRYSETLEAATRALSSPPSTTRERAGLAGRAIANKQHT